MSEQPDDIELLNKITQDSFLKHYDLNTFQEFMELTPLVKNHQLVWQLYFGNYNFTHDQLLILLTDLKYLGSSKTLDILVLMKYEEFYKKFNFAEHIDISF